LRPLPALCACLRCDRNPGLPVLPASGGSWQKRGDRIAGRRAPLPVPERPPHNRRKAPVVTEWTHIPGLAPYAETLARMEARAAAIAAGEADEAIWLLEHPPLYTAGTSARVADLVEPDRFPVFAAGRGGQYTYHGPGQRVVYTML